MHENNSIAAMALNKDVYVNDTIRALLASRQSAFMLLNAEGEILSLSPRCFQLFACQPEDWLGEQFQQIFKVADNENTQKTDFPPQALCAEITTNRAMPGRGLFRYELTAIGHFSSQMDYYLCHLTALQSDSISQPINHERNHRNVLIREVHHQIKNHLQGVMSLLEINMLEHPEVEAVLHKSLSQIGALAITFGLKSHHQDGRIYLCDLVKSSVELARSFPALNDKKIRLQIPPDKPYALDRDHAIPMSLIINELLLNAIKHDRDARQTINVRLKVEADKNACLSIINYTGRLPDAFDFNGGQRLNTGLGLVKAMLPDSMHLTLSNRQEGGVLTRLAVSNSLCWE